VEEFWGRFRLDPRLPANAAMRASDADREVVRGQLDEAYADGRLGVDEHGERVTAVLTAVTLGDLPPIVADLVPTEAAPAGTLAPLRDSDLQARAEATWRRRMRDDVGGFAFLGVLLWSIWLVTLVSGHGTGFPWPIFPTVFVGLKALDTVSKREQIVAKERAKLERRRRKELGE
jgi:hypothetical protein